MNTSKYKQTTLEQYKNWNRTQGTHTHHATKEPHTTQCVTVMPQITCDAVYR